MISVLLHALSELLADWLLLQPRPSLIFYTLNSFGKHTIVCSDPSSPRFAYSFYACCFVHLSNSKWSLFSYHSWLVTTQSLYMPQNVRRFQPPRTNICHEVDLKAQNIEGCGPLTLYPKLQPLVSNHLSKSLAIRC